MHELRDRAEPVTVCVRLARVFRGADRDCAVTYHCADYFWKTARRFLWGYSLFIAVLFFPIGTAVGLHTL